MISKKIHDLSVNILKRSSFRGDLANKKVYDIIEFPENEELDNLYQKVPVSIDVILKMKDYLLTYLSKDEIRSLEILAYLCDPEQKERYFMYGLRNHIICSSVHNVTKKMGMDLKKFYSCINIAYPYYLSLLKACCES